MTGPETTTQTSQGPRGLLPTSGTLGIALVLLAMVCISINDMLIKRLSGSYPLHEIVFIRSCLGILITTMLLKLEGGFVLLRTRQPGLHAIRALLIVAANMTYFLALAALPSRRNDGDLLRCAPPDHAPVDPASRRHRRPPPDRRRFRRLPRRPDHAAPRR